MKHIVIVALVISLSAAVMAGEPATPAALSVEQIVAKNIEARGGVDAWHKIRTMVWVGHVETANAPAARIPFMLEQKFPNKTRFEIRGQNQMSLRMFDGVNGWKLRPAANGTPQLEPFTSSELSFAHDGQGIEGPLIDYAAKGIAVTLGGIDELEGQPAYRLDLRLPSGASHHLWLDAQTFLERRYDRPAVNAGGQPATVSVVYADYRSWEGVQIPLRIETGSDSTKTPDRMVIDRLALNPPLGDALFAKPQVAAQATRGVRVDTRSAVHAQAVAGQAMPGR